MNARLASQLPLVLMAEQDTLEADRLRDDIRTALETMLHPRTVAKLQPGLGVVSSILYYTLSLLSPTASTPGQEFSDLVMVKETKSTQGSMVFTKISSGRYAATALLMALLPRLGELWDEYGHSIVEHTRRLHEVVAANDGDPRPAVEESATDSMGIPEGEQEAHAGALRAAAAWVRDKVGTQWALAKSAAVGATKEICVQLNTDDAAHGNGAAAGLSHIAALVADVNHLFFVAAGLYYHLSLRIAGVQLMQTVRLPSRGGPQGRARGAREVSLRVLRWVLGLRLALLGVHGLGLFLKHWKLQRRHSETTAAAAAAAAASVAGRDAGAGGESAVQEQERLEREALERTFDVAGASDRACPLCMEVLRCPAATPCGHVYCWECIQGLCVRSELLGGATALVQSKCPVCRSMFQAREVRAIM